MTYVIEVRNRGLRGDTWQHWGAADSEADATRWAAKLRAALGRRYQVRRRRIETEGSAK